jgi:hypothetical protein
MSLKTRRRTPLVIAVLTSAARSVRFGGNRGNFRDLLIAAKRQQAVAYVVTVPEMINGLANQSVHGYGYDERRKQWYAANFPFPQVIYNRIPTRAQEKTTGVQELTQRLRQRTGVHFFNPHFFNKWQLAKWLADSSELKAHVPQTRPLRNAKSLMEMLSDSSELFLKPVHGKAGAGMMRLEQKADKSWTLSRQSANGTSHQRYHVFAKLWRDLRRAMNGKAYVIQQFVALERSSGAPFDLRLLLQKNRLGQWTVSGIGARVAGRNRLTTHVPRGGTIASPLRLLREKYGADKAKQLLVDAGKLGVRIARHIEKQSAQLLGEMSMDMGLDQHGKLWFFEANSHPMKFDEPAIRRRSLRKWVRFCRFLASRT